MSYQVRLNRAAVKTLDRVDRPTEQRLRNRIQNLAANPYDPRISKWLVNAPQKRVSRVGHWRIVYSADLEAKVVDVLLIETRGEVYRRL